MKQNSSARRLWGVSLLLVLCAACQIHVCGCSVYPRVLHKRTVELQRPLVSGRTVEVKTSSGSITVEGADTTECHVVARISVRAGSEARAAEIAEEIEILINQTGDGLEIRADKPRIHNVSISVSYDVTVPRQTSVVGQSSSGSLKVLNLEGNVNAQASSGSVRCENLLGESAALNTSSGSVHLADVKVNACRLHASSGSIRGQQVDCPDIRANVSSGSITIVCARAVSQALKADLQTSSGSVNFTVPQAYSGRIDLSTSSGAIHTDLPVTVQGKVSKKHLVGTVGQGDGHIKLKSSSGSVRLRTLQ